MHELSARVRFTRQMAAEPHPLRLYGILDAETCSRRNLDLFSVATAWKLAGIRLIQYRDKLSNRQELEARALQLRALFPAQSDTFLILNDHPEMAARCSFDGVHVGQEDAGVDRAREVVGQDRIVGVSTHSVDQAMSAQDTDCDYVAVGPVYPTSTKADASPVVGLCGVQAARAVVRKPLVAIGGINVNRAEKVIAAGANTVAVISGLIVDCVDLQAKAFVQTLQAGKQASNHLAGPTGHFSDQA